jgi:hypothetical protein
MTINSWRFSFSVEVNSGSYWNKSGYGRRGLFKISGDDKCKYAVFSSENGLDYQKTAEMNKACLSQTRQ